MRHYYLFEFYEIPLFYWNIGLVFFFFLFKAVKDKIQFHYNNSIFHTKNRKLDLFINPAISWRNKWKNGDKKYGERFLGSSTVFVMFTDLWHLLGFFQYLIISILISINSPYSIFNNFYFLDCILYLTFGLIIFEIFFGRIFNKRN